MIRNFFGLAALISLICLALGFTGRWMALGDSLAVFRLPNLMVSAVLMLALRPRKPAMVALGLVCLSAVSIATHYRSQTIDPQQPRFQLYQKNLLFRAKNRAALKADILETGADFVTLQEVTQENFAFISQFKASYPFALTCPFAGVGGVTVLSRWPSTGESHCHDSYGMSAMKVKPPTGDLWVISIHLYWPYPHGQAEQVKRVIEQLKTLKGPKIIAGDFNMVPWSHTVKAFERASNTQIAQPVIQSFDLPIIPLRIPIDHVLLPKGSKAQTQRRGKKGSDHYGVVASFNLP